MQSDGICLDYSHICRKYTSNEITKLLNEGNKSSYATTKQNKEDWNKNERIRKKNAHLNYNQARSIQNHLLMKRLVQYSYQMNGRFQELLFIKFVP